MDTKMLKKKKNNNNLAKRNSKIFVIHTAILNISTENQS